MLPTVVLTVAIIGSVKEGGVSVAEYVEGLK
jgi:hypothetical protein